MEVYHNKINDIVVFNGDRNKKGSIYLVAKGGLPNQAHQQMDCGTFIVESDGVLWTEDLGADDYDLPGFWDGKPGGQRWKYFRNNNFSHNVINIDHSLQYANGHAFVCEEHPEAKQPSVKLNLCEVYKEKAKSAYRKFTLLNNYTIEVEDEVKRMLERNARVITVEGRAAADGDIVTLDFDGYVDDKAFEGGPAAIYGKLIDMGATLIQTDRPELLISYLRSRGLHD